MTTVPAKPRRGCLFYGFIIGSVLLLAILAALLLGLHYFKQMLNEYTDTRPMPLPTVEVSSAEAEALQRRVEVFRDALRAGRPTAPLAMTGEEIDVLIATTPNLQGVKTNVYVTIEGNHLKGQMSIPMEQVGLPVFKGRYLNGTGTFGLWLQNGQLHVSVQSFEVKGKPLPEVYMSKIQQQNLARNLNRNPSVSIGLDKLQDIQIKDGKLILIPKPE
ncbi:MAG TPA: hypothetical protein VNZ22_08800 [Bacillota bacterium]|nr:hypothetical protein [Bacillota bacterium]